MSSFVEKYGGIYEHSPWVAELAEPVVGDSTDMEEIARVMADCVDNAGKDQRLALVRAHPDLAGKAQIAGELTADSTTEQSSAGLDQCRLRKVHPTSRFTGIAVTNPPNAMVDPDESTMVS